MRYKTLGTTGEKLSALTLGTWGIGGTGWGETSQSNSLAAIDRMLELGVNLVDTAPVYGFGNPGEQDFGFGCAERLLAKALKGRRDKVFLVTKCGLNYDRSKGPSSAYRSMSAQEIREGAKTLCAGWGPTIWICFWSIGRMERHRWRRLLRLWRT